MMPSYQHEPKSLKNVSCSLLNLCHKVLKQVWRQKGKTPYYQIKQPVSVYMGKCTDKELKLSVMYKNIHSVQPIWYTDSKFCGFWCLFIGMSAVIEVLPFDFHFSFQGICMFQFSLTSFSVRCSHFLTSSCECHFPGADLRSLQKILQWK